MATKTKTVKFGIGTKVNRSGYKGTVTGIRNKN